MCKLFQEFNASETQENKAKLYVQNVMKFWGQDLPILPSCPVMHTMLTASILTP